MAYDPALQLVYIGTANAAPYNSHLGGRRGGDELYAASIIAIHADDGRMAWYYQTTPRDSWDFDTTQKMILTDLDIGGTIDPVRKHENYDPKRGWIDKMANHGAPRARRRWPGPRG